MLAGVAAQHTVGPLALAFRFPLVTVAARIADRIAVAVVPVLAAQTAWLAHVRSSCEQAEPGDALPARACSVVVRLTRVNVSPVPHAITGAVKPMRGHV